MIIRQIECGYFAGRLSSQEAEIVCKTRSEVIDWLLKLKEFQLK